MSETSSVMKIPLAHCSRSKVHKSLINNANSSGLLTSPCLVPILQRKAFVRPLTVGVCNCSVLLDVTLCPF